MILAGFILGITVSLHCAGMCGPLVLILNSERPTLGKLLIKNVSYGIGKTITYFCLGALVGTLGFGINIAGLQQWLSLSSGILLLLYVVFNNYKLNIPASSIFERLNSKISKWITLFIVRKNIKGAILFGMLNGLLPCGVLYIALSVALNSGTPLRAALYMASFGFGTLIMLFTIALSGNFISKNFISKVPWVSKILSVAIALMLIIRGLDIGIPYISPKIENSNNTQVLECCKGKQPLKK